MIFESYRADMVSRGIKPHSLLTYDRVTRLYEEYLREQGVRPIDAKPGHVQMFLQQTGWSPRTQSTGLDYLRAAYNYTVDMLEMLDRNPCRKVRLERPTKKVARTVPNSVLRELRQTVGSRDELTLAMFVWTGMRTIEVRRIKWRDVDWERNTLLVFGKGDKERLVPVHPELRILLLRYRGPEFGHIVPGRGHNMITVGGMHYRMKKIAGQEIRNHDFRRTVATSLRANRVDPYIRDWIMGWHRDEQFAAYNDVAVEELHEGILRLYANDPI